MRYIVTFLLFLLVAVIAQEQCLSNQEMVVDLEEPEIDWRTRVLVVSHKYLLKNEPNSEANLTELVQLEPIELKRIERSWHSHYWRIDPNLLANRSHIIPNLAGIDMLIELEKRMASRVELYNGKTYQAKPTDQVKSIMDSFDALHSEFDQVGKDRYHNCSTWKFGLQADWQAYRAAPSSFNVTPLRETLQMLKQKSGELAERTIQLWSQVSEEDQLAFPSAEAKMLENVMQWRWMEKFYGEYLKWIETGVRPVPEKCVQPKAVPIADAMESQVYKDRQRFTLAHLLYRDQNYAKNESNQRLAERLRSHQEIRDKFTANLTSLNMDDLHARYLMEFQFARLDALIELEQQVQTRMDFYHTQQRSFFNGDDLVDYLPIEISLGQLDRDFAQLARERANGCELWSEVLDAEWKSFQQNPSNFEGTANLRETLQLIHQKAIDSKNQVTQLMSQVPEYRSRFLRIETELEIFTSLKVFERMAALFGEYLQRMDSVSKRT